MKNILRKPDFTQLHGFVHMFVCVCGGAHQTV